MPDSRMTLDELNRKWNDCRACDLGVRRELNQGHFVAGEGTRRGIMFVGEGPGEMEESVGKPFIGPSGELLRRMIKKLGLENFYITNIVSCRSCSPVTDEKGEPRMRKRYGKPPLPMMKDEPPLPVQMAACSKRLFDEIYIVDPILIVTLGVTSAQLLLGHPVTITKDRGQTEHAYIPGATFRPVLTEKKGVWARKLSGQLTLPIEPNEVRYEVMPTLHPAYVLRKLADRGLNSPFQQLSDDLRYAVKIYERYMLEAYGTVPSGNSDTVIPSDEINPYEE